MLQLLKVPLPGLVILWEGFYKPTFYLYYITFDYKGDVDLCLEILGLKEDLMKQIKKIFPKIFSEKGDCTSFISQPRCLNQNTRSLPITSS